MPTEQEQNQHNPNGSLLNDSHTLNAIRAFVAAPKPEGIGATEVLHIIHLLSRKAEDHAVYDAQATLAQSFGVDIKTIARSQQRLVAAGWLVKPRRKGMTNGLSLLYEELPFAEPQYTQVTDAAKMLAWRYKQALSKQFKRMKFPRGWLQQQHISAQRILDRCDGDIELAARIIGHALWDKQHTKTAQKSLYHLLFRWRKIMATYTVAFPQKEVA